MDAKTDDLYLQAERMNLESEGLRRGRERRERENNLQAEGLRRGNMDDLVIDLDRLAELHRVGELTDDQYELAKQKRLNG